MIGFDLIYIFPFFELTIGLLR